MGELGYRRRMQANELPTGKLYRGKHFAGYGIAVNGELLEGQLSARTESRGGEPPTVTVTFRLTAEHIENQPVIKLNRV